MAEANLLEELLNWRRASQKDAISLLNAWKKEGIFSSDIPHCGVNLTGISEAAAHNRRILTHYLPQLSSMMEFKHPLCWKSASLAGKRIRFGTNRVTISEPIGWNHRRVIQLPCDLHLIHTDIRCVYLNLSLFPTGYEPGCTLFSVTVPQDSIKSRLDKEPTRCYKIRCFKTRCYTTAATRPSVMLTIQRSQRSQRNLKSKAVNASIAERQSTLLRNARRRSAAMRPVRRERSRET
jgi:hypothetical protein